MKQCPKRCQLCRAPIVDIGHYVGIDGLGDETYLWTCARPSCRDDAIRELDRGYPLYNAVRRIGPDGKPMLAPDASHPIRGEITVRVQQIQRVDVHLVSQRVASGPERRSPGGIALP